MKKFKRVDLNSLGFSHIEMIVAIVVIAVIGAVGVKVLRASHAASVPSIVYTNGQGKIATINGDGTGNKVLYKPSNSTVFNDVWGQNSSTIFFTLGTAASSNIYSMSSSGSDVKRIPSTSVKYAQYNFNGFTYSESAQKLAFITDDKNSTDQPNALYSIGINGSGKKLLYELPASDGGMLYDVSFSPNGKLILFDSMDGNTRNIYTVNTNGGGLTAQVTATTSDTPNNLATSFRNAWTPDSSEFVYLGSSGAELETLNINTGTSTAIFPLKGQTVPPFTNFGNFTLSPNGEEVAAIVVNSTVGSNLLTIPINDSDQPQTLVSYSGCTLLNDVDWSPDSSQLVYLLADAPCGPTGKHQLYTISASGGASTQLTTPGAKIFPFDWSIQ